MQERIRATVDAKVTECQRQITELTLLTADLQRAAAGLRAEPATGGCDDMCGCLAGGAPAAGSTAMVVPLDAKDDLLMAAAMALST